MNLTIETLPHRGLHAVRKFRATGSFPFPCMLAGWLIASLIFCSSSAAQTTDLLLGHAAIVGDAGTGLNQGPISGNFNLNSFLGADRFYNAGFHGSNSIIANIEAGRAWSGHETLGHVQNIPSSGAIGGGEVDRHATWVSMLMGGRQGGANPGTYQEGVASQAALYTGAIATNWASAGSPPRWSGSFFTNTSVGFGTYRRAFNTGLAGTRPADVINSSFNGLDGGDPDGNGPWAVGIDGLANANTRTLMTIAAGNGGNSANTVLSPASGYNTLIVGALEENANYNAPASFTSTGPSNYSDPVNGTIQNARWVVDIAAPGTAIASAYYGGETGGNRPALGGSPGGSLGGPDYYNNHVRGTSFSAPIVAGGAALLYDAAYALLGGNGDARDARVVKAVLMNSADKTSNWNNGQQAHSNGNGGVMTTQALDSRVGTGRMNLDQAFDQFLSGTTDVAGLGTGFLGSVNELGWDFGQLTDVATNDYEIGQSLVAGTTFNATLTWFRERRQLNSNGTSDDSFANLNLELWKMESGVATTLISESSSMYNSSEHFSFAIPETDKYMLRVRWAGEIFDRFSAANVEQYGLAWSGTAIPEPTSAMLSVLAMLLGGAVRRRVSD